MPRLNREPSNSGPLGPFGLVHLSQAYFCHMCFWHSEFETGGCHAERFIESHCESRDRRSFIGGSDARIIMGNDEAALLRLWREKRGEVEPEDLSGNLMVQLGLPPRTSTGAGTRPIPARSSPTSRSMSGTRRCSWMAATLDGRVEASGAVFEAKFMLPWSFSEEAAGGEVHAAAAAQHVGRGGTGGGALDHHRRRQMGRDQDPCRSALPAPHRHGRAEILALRRERRAPAPVWRRAAASRASRPSASSI